MCGGTRPELVEGTDREGLSPRVRGNQPEVWETVAEPGSIPACAGEPVGVPMPPEAGRVYPRVCGGT